MCCCMLFVLGSILQRKLQISPLYKVVSKQDEKSNKSYKINFSASEQEFCSGLQEDKFREGGFVLHDMYKSFENFKSRYSTSDST